ncbi:MAG TPA: exodeoxyribonuclease VII large subunit [Caldilineae bacterium]|nr:exodeoxyribonuclease VII large subunit [Caldilineae bacterium]
MSDLLTVSQLLDYLTAIVREDALLADVMVQGEISNALRAKSGHFYFSLKDASATISCVMWRSAVRALPEIPQEGQRVRVSGRVDIYAPRGQLQLVVSAMVVGDDIGALYLRFEESKRRLQAEGLFDAERKRPLPAIPKRIGIVTSATGAALRDMLRVLGQRWPLADVLLVPSLVQGAQAPAALQAALFSLYDRDDIDVIVLARGGGSIEDLWAFNDEGLARLVAESPVPVVSGVGHETDFTLVDFVADVRAATPSAAAAALTPDAAGLRQSLDGVAQRLQELTLNAIARRRLETERARSIVQRYSPQYRIDQQRLLIDELERRLTQNTQDRLRRWRLALDGLAQRLEALNPNAVLSRGYAIVQDDAGGVISSVTQTSAGQALSVRVADGSFPVVVTGQKSLFQLDE